MNSKLDRDDAGTHFLEEEAIVRRQVGSDLHFVIFKKKCPQAAKRNFQKCPLAIEINVSGRPEVSLAVRR